MYLILGLGNPGPRYELTRHNIGFLVVDILAEKYSIKLDKHQFNSLYGEGDIDGFPVVVAKPMTYMNDSGKAARALSNVLGLEPAQVIVVHDDIDLPLGKIKCKAKGGDAGQRGVASIRHRLGTDGFWRVRVGIGRPDNRNDIVDYVLTPFEEEETSQLNEVLEEAVTRIEQIMKELKAKSIKDKTEEQPE